MIVIPVKNIHAAIHDACRRATDPSESSPDGVNSRMRYPLTYVVDRPLESAPLWGGDPFMFYKGRLAWAASQILFADGLLDGARAMKTDAVQVILSIGDTGHVHYQSNEGALEAFVVEPFVDAVEFDFGRVTFLTELLSVIGNMPVGRMWLTSPAFCVRNTNMEQADRIARCALKDPYQHLSVRTTGEDLQSLFRELPDLIEIGPAMGMVHPYIRRVAAPIFAAHGHLLERRYPEARKALERCEAQDWKDACGVWINKMERKPS